MKTPSSLTTIPVSILVLLTGCATSARDLPVSPAPPEGWCCTGGHAEITIEYLGVGGWLFRMEEAALLTAPFFSNPGLLDVGIGRIETDTAMVDRFLPPVQDVAAILVGHAHYDHLMDVPYILRTKAPNAQMYGSRTAVNLLMGDPMLDDGRLHDVEEAAGTHDVHGDWTYVAEGRIRFMALRSGHAPHFMGIHLYEGQADEPSSTLPTRAGQWLEGTPLAYLIDFLSPAGEVVYRVHYQDAASTAPDGFPPPLDDDIPVNLAILCPPGYQEVTGYPEEIVGRLAPAAVLLGHWEDFFRPRSEALRGVPATDLETFIDRLEAVLPDGARWSMFEPGTSLRILTED